MKRLIKEELKVNKFKHNNVDPFSEEDWDEFEISNGDEFYIFGMNNYDVFAGSATAVDINDGRYYISIDKTINNIDTKKTKIRLPDGVISYINKKQYYNNQNEPIYINENLYINIIVTKRKLIDYYKPIHETIRKVFYSNIKSLQKTLRRYQETMDKNEEKVISLKRNLKSEDEFPSPNDIELEKDQYIVIKVNNNDISNIVVDVMLTKMDKNVDDKGGKNLIDIETGQKSVYLLKNAEKLINNKYLLLKSKRDKNIQTYITNDLEKIYPEFINKIVNNINSKINENIEKHREEFKELISKTKEKREKMDEIRKNYLEFKFSDLVSKLKEL